MPSRYNFNIFRFHRGFGVLGFWGFGVFEPLEGHQQHKKNLVCSEHWVFFEHWSIVFGGGFGSVKFSVSKTSFLTKNKGFRRILHKFLNSSFDCTVICRFSFNSRWIKSPTQSSAFLASWPDFCSHRFLS